MSNKKIFIPLLLLTLVAFTGCLAPNFVTITPPNYAVVVDRNNTNNQATGNAFENGELVDITQIRVNRPRCAPLLSGSAERCPDKFIAEIPGAPQSRVYTQDPTTGTSGADEAICFEASGVNGCVDFSVSAQVLRKDAACYANKVGVRSVNESKFHYAGLPLADALDTRMIQIASARMVVETAQMNPLSLATDKFEIFEEIRPEIIEEVYNQTCITINQINLSGGINWDSAEIQATIDDAIVLENQLALAIARAEVEEQEAANLIVRVNAYAEEFGIEAAIRLIAIEEWNGSYLPADWLTPTSADLGATDPLPTPDQLDSVEESDSGN